jgi:hypothetical protein
MKTNTTNQTFSLFLAENQRPITFQKEFHTARGTINQSMKVKYNGNSILLSPLDTINGAGSGVTVSIVCSRR